MVAAVELQFDPALKVREGHLWFIIEADAREGKVYDIVKGVCCLSSKSKNVDTSQPGWSTGTYKQKREGGFSGLSSFCRQLAVTEPIGAKDA